MRGNKIILVGLLVFLFAGYAQAQRQKPKNLPKYDFKKFHFGFTIGLNQMNFVSNNQKDFNSIDTLLTIEPSPQMGFNIGIVSSMKLGTYTDLRFVPTLSFGDRRINYNIKLNDSIIAHRQKAIESTYLDFPLTLKYKSKRLNNYRMYVLGGVRYSLDLASQKSKKGDDFENILVKLRPHDLSGEVGVGADFFMDFFKFGIELKMAYGVMDLLEREGNVYTDGIKSLQSKIFWLTFTFE